jgi:hypothetical protein
MSEYIPQQLDLLAAAVLARTWRDANARSGRTMEDGCFVIVNAVDRARARRWWREHGIMWCELLAPGLHIPEMDMQEARP